MTSSALPLTHTRSRRPHFPLALRLRFLWWRLRPVLLLLLCAILLLLSVRGGGTGTAQKLPTAVRGISFGSVVSSSDFSFLISDDSSSFEGKVALVNIAAGSAVVPQMFGDSVQEALVPQGKVLATAALSNVEILQFVGVGSFVEIYSMASQESEPIVSGAQIIRLPASGAGYENQNTWGFTPHNNTDRANSSTVLLAVSESEAHRLAQVPTWESALVAVLKE